jgi:5-formyltetrahydrofolate cyclo-ligase
VPLLAFDTNGHRLGYGGGYYDRTLDFLRANSTVRAIGVAYAGQEVAELPREAHDHPLDAIITETGVHEF